MPRSTICSGRTAPPWRAETGSGSRNCRTASGRGRRRGTRNAPPSPSVESRQSPGEVDPSRIRREALQALEKGNIGQVEELAKKMLGRDAPHPVRPSSSVSAHAARRDLSVPFPPETLPKAGSLGLASMTLAPAVEVGEYFGRGW